MPAQQPDDEVVRTTGRRMSRQLQDAIDGLYGKQRRVTRAVLTEVGHDDSYGRLLRAVLLELDLSDLRSQAVIRRIEQDASADLPDGPPLPRPAAGAWWPEDDGAA